jgi:hypothetical protein
MKKYLLTILYPPGAVKPAPEAITTYIAIAAGHQRKGPTYVGPWGCG